MNYVRKCWVYRKDRAVVKQQLIREYIYAFTTVCPQTGETFSMISPFCNTNAMNIFLKDVSEYYPNYRIVMVMDSAGWHTTKHLELPENIIIDENNNIHIQLDSKFLVEENMFLWKDFVLFN